MRRNNRVDLKNPSNYKYQFNSKQYDLDLSNRSFDSQIGATRAKEPVTTTLPEKIKSNGSFSLERVNHPTSGIFNRGAQITVKKPRNKIKDFLKLPQISKEINPEQENHAPPAPTGFYISKVHKAFKNH